jgi:hypothetical protein
MATTTLSLPPPAFDGSARPHLPYRDVRPRPNPPMWLDATTGERGSDDSPGTHERHIAPSTLYFSPDSGCGWFATPKYSPTGQSKFPTFPFFDLPRFGHHFSRDCISEWSAVRRDPRGWAGSPDSRKPDYPHRARRGGFPGVRHAFVDYTRRRSLRVSSCATSRVLHRISFVYRAIPSG